MRRSRIGIYLAILKVLAQKGAQRTSRIGSKANVNFLVLRQCLIVLIRAGLIERLLAKNRPKEAKRHVVFAITYEGVMLLKNSKMFENLQLAAENKNYRMTCDPIVQSKSLNSYDVMSFNDSKPSWKDQWSHEL